MVLVRCPAEGPVLDFLNMSRLTYVLSGQLCCTFTSCPGNRTGLPGNQTQPGKASNVKRLRLESLTARVTKLFSCRLK
jgi:hypothetical protein